MLAIIKTGGKQYKVKEGDKIQIEKIDGKEGETVLFEEILFAGNEKKVKVGEPFLKGVKVEGKILAEKKTKKVKTIKHKAKKRYLIRKGHRQNILEVEITKISV